MLVSFRDGIADAPLPRTPTTVTNCLDLHSVPRGVLGAIKAPSKQCAVPSNNLSHSIAPAPWGTIACRRLGRDSGSSWFKF